MHAAHHYHHLLNTDLRVQMTTPLQTRGEGRLAIQRRASTKIVLFWVRDEGEGPIAVKDRRLGTDRRRSRQRTATIGVFGFATVQGVRHALAGIERAT